jgi:hypothetical protein
MRKRFHLIYCPDGPASASPYRLFSRWNRQASMVNSFLDAQNLRGLSPCSLRAYGFDLLHFSNW